MNRRSRTTTHFLSHRFSRKFDILNQIRTIDIDINIIYKRKAPKINSMIVEIIDESKLRTNFK